MKMKLERDQWERLASRARDMSSAASIDLWEERGEGNRRSQMTRQACHEGRDSDSVVDMASSRFRKK